MQPYLFPYLGYFQLVMAADKFIFFDDVNFIKRGYINRNSYLIQGQSKLLTVPVENMSQNRKINEHTFSDPSNFIKTIEQNYSKAPHFASVMPIIRSVMQHHKTSDLSIVCSESISQVMTYLGLKKQFLSSSQLNYDRNAGASQKIISLCNLVGANTYINPEGGRELYNRELFKNSGIDLLFIKPNLPEYRQIGTKNFVSHLSILDILMFNSISEARPMLDAYQFWGD